jgi:hypothetical protein
MSMWYTYADKILALFERLVVAVEYLARYARWNLPPDRR